LGMIQELEQIAPVHISDIYSIEDNLKLIKMYGQLFSKEVEAIEIISSLKKKYDDFKTFIHDKSNLKTVYFIWKNPWMVAANQTFIDEILKLNNFENYYSNLNRYPEIELVENKQ